MATAVLENERQELVEFRRQDAAIAKLAETFMPLRIESVDDKEGFKKVHEARMIVKNTRVGLEKTRVALKADALAYGRAVDSEAKRLFGLIEPIESHLDREEAKVTEEKKRREAAAAEAKRLRLQNRLDALVKVAMVADPRWVEELSDEAFAKELADATAEFEAQKAEQAEAAAKRKAEEEALAAERAELDKIRKEQEAERARLAAEQKRLDDERKAKEHAEEIERAKAEAAEKAKRETEERLAREAEQKRLAEEASVAREKAEAEAKEAARIKAEAERPHREKLLAVADAVDAISVPVGPGCNDVNAILNNAANEIRAVARGELK